MPWWRLVGIIAATTWGLLVALPSFLPPSMRSSLPSWMPQKEVTLGLDLQGGVHLLLEVDTPALVKDIYNQGASAIRKQARKEGLTYQAMRVQSQGILWTPKTPQDLDTLKAKMGGWGMAEYQVDAQSNGAYLLHLHPKAEQEITRQAVAKSIEVIRKRIDETGALEPLIQGQGSNRIILQIPGFQDPQKVHQLLGKTAKLTFQWVVDEAHPASGAPVSMAVSRDRSERGDRTERLPIDPEILMTGEDVIQARADFSRSPEDMEPSAPVVSLRMTQKGTRLFGDITAQENRGRLMAIILDKTVLSAPRINEPITGGQAVIQGMRSLDEAQALALMINSGALPAPLKILEEKVVGPQLGQDSILQGTRGTLLAILAVILWMLAIYSGFGVFAVVGIACNLCFLFAALVLLNATLTLPGLAGIALTVGMSVDANVLINERIKEELHAGYGLAQAIASGYEKARASILDSNLTTLAGSLALYAAGTGPVRGFAVTMALGILISLFTAIGLTALLVRAWMTWVRPRRLWI